MDIKIVGNVPMKVKVYNNLFYFLNNVVCKTNTYSAAPRLQKKKKYVYS